jgi:hypothetical protein
MSLSRHGCHRSLFRRDIRRADIEWANIKFCRCVLSKSIVKLARGSGVDRRGLRQIAKDKPEGMILVPVQHNLVSIQEMALLTLGKQRWRIFRCLLWAASHVDGVDLREVANKE